MQFSSDWTDREARIIGQRVYFDIREDRLRNVAQSEYQVQLDWSHAQVLLQLVQAPGQVLAREEIRKYLARQNTRHLTDHALDEIVAALQAAFRRLDPNTVYIRMLPRLGYVLVSTVMPASTAPKSGSDTMGP